MHVTYVLAELPGHHAHGTEALLTSNILLIVLQSTLILADELAHHVAKLVFDQPLMQVIHQRLGDAIE